MLLTHTHSVLRWVALILLVYAIINALRRKNSGDFSKNDKLINLFAMLSLHIQLVLGLVLYFMSGKVNFPQGWMKHEVTRFYGMEHLVGMLLAIALVTVGYSKAKRSAVAAQKHTNTLIFYTIGLLLILSFIPWSFRTSLDGHWY